MREPRRSWTLVVVLALHLALITALMRFSKTLPLSTPIAAPLELILIPTAAAPRTRPPFARQDSSHVDTNVAPITPSPVTIPQPAAPNESAESPIDWAGEAQKAAAATTPGPEVRPFDHRFPSDSERPPKSIFDEAPEHHAGEQFRTDDGRWSCMSATIAIKFLILWHPSVPWRMAWAHRPTAEGNPNRQGAISLINFQLTKEITLGSASRYRGLRTWGAPSHTCRAPEGDCCQVKGGRPWIRLSLRLSDWMYTKTPSRWG